MDRRSLLKLAGVGAAAGAGAGAIGLYRKATMSSRPEPWHLWGSEATVHVPDVSDGLRFQTSTQLANVKYKRPDTWSFLLGAQLLKAPEVGIGSNLLVIVQFQLRAGVGRTQLFIPATDNGFNTGFARFVWKFGAKPIFPAQLKWTTTVHTPPLDEGLVTPIQEACSEFPAQSIQCDAQVVAVSATGAVGDPETVVALHAYFAPKTHIRPDWFKHDFSGELEGL